MKLIKFHHLLKIKSAFLKVDLIKYDIMHPEVIETPLSPWKGEVLPLNYECNG